MTVLHTGCRGTTIADNLFAINTYKSVKISAGRWCMRRGALLHRVTQFLAICVLLQCLPKIIFLNLDYMKYTVNEAGLLVLAWFSSILPVAAGSLDIATTTRTSFAVEVYRDWDAVKAEMKAKKNIQDRAKMFWPRVANSDYSTYWFANITAGGLPVQVLVDTGSADFWLVSPSAPTDATNGVQTWEPSKGAITTPMSGYSFSIGYGQGGNGVSGYVYQTPVCIGAACTVMAVGSATYDAGLGNFPRSGIMGFAFGKSNSIQPEHQPTFMESLQPQLQDPIFVTNFAPEGGSSQIAFGANPFSYVAPLQNITAQSGPGDSYPYSWSFSGVQYFKQGQFLGKFDVVFDTGGPSTSAGESIVRGYYNGIPGVRDVYGDASSWTVPCGTQLPDLVMYLGTAVMTIPGNKFYNGNTATSGTCDVWFVKENSASRGLVGDPFFTQHVVIFNQEASTIQWGKQA